MFNCCIARNYAKSTGERSLKIGRQLAKLEAKLECGPMSNVMVALPNIGVALCSMPQSLADAHY